MKKYIIFCISFISLLCLTIVSFGQHNVKDLPKQSGNIDVYRTFHNHKLNIDSLWNGSYSGYIKKDGSINYDSSVTQNFPGLNFNSVISNNQIGNISNTNNQAVYFSNGRIYSQDSVFGLENYFILGDTNTVTDYDIDTTINISIRINGRNFRIPVVKQN